MNKHLFRIVLAIGVICIAIVSLFRFVLLDKPTTKSVITSTVLTEVIDIAELYTAEFKYRGIANVYTDDSHKQIKCRACYNAIVKAGIELNKVTLDREDAEMIVYANLPDIELKVTIIDEQSMALLPSDTDVGIDNLLRYCKEDAENEAKESEELMQTARENMKATVEGLLYPLLKAENYSLIWK